MTSTRSSDQSPKKLGGLSVAERMRHYRRRRGRGLRCVQVHVGQAELDGLVAEGYLLSADRNDAYTIGLAISDLMFDWLHRA